MTSRRRTYQTHFTERLRPAPVSPGPLPLGDWPGSFSFWCTGTIPDLSITANGSRLEVEHLGESNEIA
jgi:hypothetical protein